MQSRSVTGVGPAKSAALPSAAVKSGVGVKRSLSASRPPAATTTAAAAAAAPKEVKNEVSELGLKPLVSCPPGEAGAAVTDAAEGEGEGGAGEGEGEGEGGGDPLEEKRMKRMRRNRESAAMSRNRKKAYIEELEAKVAALKASVQQLQSENQTLKQTCSSAPASAAAAAGATAPGALQAAGSSSDALAEDDLGLSIEQLGAVVGDDLCLLSPLDIPTPRGEEVPSTLPGSKKMSTAALAMMSALTFVTLSANSSGPLWSRDAPHSPTSRVLMSLSDEPVRGFGREEEMPLWPAIDALAIDTLKQPLTQPPQAQPLYESPEPIASALASALPTPQLTPQPPPVRPPASASASSHGSHGSHGSHVRVEQVEREGEAGKEAGRVLVLPRNSSWADALRVEAAEKQLMVRGEAAILHGGGGAMPPVAETGALLASPLPLQLKAAAPADKVYDKVYEPAWKDSAEEDEEYFDQYDPHSIESEKEQRRRFIFCARAYTFDVSAARRASPPAAPKAPAPAAPAPSRELSLPAMPARFRHGAGMAAIHELPKQGLPQLTDGQGLPHVAGNESEPLPLPSARYPIVKMLLPSAALSGVVTGADERGSEDLSGDLMQVSCQVLNASRWGGA